MITAEELRIGNLVMYNGMVMRVSEICSPKPLKDKRYSDKYIIELFDGAGLLSCTIDEISSVPITQERLLNFGFRKINETSHFRLGSFYCVLEDGICAFYYHQSLLKDLKHIHKLQNLWFALTGNELVLNKN